MDANAGVNPKLPTWDGDWRTFTDYQLACQLESDGLREEDRPTLAPRLARNLTAKAWEACLDIDRSELRKEKGLDYLLEFLKRKRGKQQVDMLGEALGRFFQSNEATRREKENLNDYEQRAAVFVRDIQRALRELGNSNPVPTEIYGWFLLNQHIRLEPSDVATIKSQAGSYRLDDVWTALRRMWGGDSLSLKDAERKKAGSRAFAAAIDEWPEDMPEASVWWNEDETPSQDDGSEPQMETEIWFEDALEAWNEDPHDEQVLANFMEAKRAFYKDARRALDQSRTGRGFYPAKGRGKPSGGGSEKGKGGDSRPPPPFKGKCMRCGKHGHKAQHCPQSSRSPQTGKGAGVGFVFTNWTQAGPAGQTTQETTEVSAETSLVNFKDVQMTKAILDCGASETIIGAWTLQQLGDELGELGFQPDDEIQIDRTLRKSFIYGNNQKNEALGHASVTTGIDGQELQTDMHVVDGQTPLLLSSKWLYEQGALVDFRTGQAIFPRLGNHVIQLERAPTYHLLLPVTAFQGNDDARATTRVADDQEGLLRACALILQEAVSPADAVQE